MFDWLSTAVFGSFGRRFRAWLCGLIVCVRSAVFLCVFLVFFVSFCVSSVSICVFTVFDVA